MKKGSKLHKLLVGKRTFPQRLLLALLPSLALSFTLFFFGPLDLSIVSRNFVAYTALEILPQTAILMGCVFAVLLLAASLPGGLVHAFLVSLWTGLSLGCYLQGAFLNPDFGVLDGTEINWPSFSTLMLVNLAVWFIILLVPHLIHYFSNRIWRFFVMITCAALILMQAVSLGIKLADQGKSENSGSGEFYMSSGDMLELGSDKNVIVFLLDGLSNQTLDQVEANFPNIMYPLRDFTRFDDAATHYQRTVPSVVSLLTGQFWNCSEEGYRDYFRRAWTSETAAGFYGALKGDGFRIGIYTLESETVSGLTDLNGIADNVLPLNSEKHLVRQSFLSLIKLSFYRYFPVCLKPFFRIYSTDIVTMFSIDDMYEDQWDFVNQYNSSQLTAVPNNTFKFYYLQGAHRPFSLDADGRLSGSETDRDQQTAGFLSLIGTFIHQMKLLGIYDSAEIIILADHGVAYPLGMGESAEELAAWDFQPVLLIKRPGETHESYQRNHAPVTIQDLFIPTVLQAMGLNGTAFGTSAFDVPESEPLERWSRFYAVDPEYEEYGSANVDVMREYRYTGSGYALNEQCLAGVYETFPILDSFY